MSLLSNLRYSQIYGKYLMTAQKCLGNIGGGQRNVQNENKRDKTVVIEPLVERVLIRVHGSEVSPFLQGLITNDIVELQKPNANSMYAMFLNKSGRVLYDTIIYRTDDPNTYLIECDKNISSELQRHLRIHRVKRKIQIDHLDDEYSVWTAFDPMVNSNKEENMLKESPYVLDGLLNNNTIITKDPRVEGLGKRIITTADVTWSDLARLYSRLGEVSTVAANGKRNYRNHRYSFGVAEGITEMPPGKCLPLEANGDYLNGISFNKGCYVGQELTARVYHTGVIRKRHMPMHLKGTLHRVNPDVETSAGVKIGKILGATADKAVGLLRVEYALQHKNLLVGGEPCVAVKPKWWPKDSDDDI